MFLWRGEAYWGGYWASASGDVEKEGEAVAVDFTWNRMMAMAAVDWQTLFKLGRRGGTCSLVASLASLFSTCSREWRHAWRACGAAFHPTTWKNDDFAGQRLWGRVRTRHKDHNKNRCAGNLKWVIWFDSLFVWFSCWFSESFRSEMW